MKGRDMKSMLAVAAERASATARALYELDAGLLDAVSGGEEDCPCPNPRVSQTCFPQGGCSEPTVDC